MFITDEKHNKNPILANLSCNEKSICIPLPNKICNSATWPMKKSFLNCCYLTNFLAMQKSDFHMTNFLWNEQQFLHGSCGNQISTWAMWKSDFWSLVQLVISRIFWKCMEIYQWPSLILTHTGISIFSIKHVITRPTKIIKDVCKAST